MKIYNCEQNTPEWITARLGKFTASNGLAIATQGKGLETLVYKLAAEILTGKQEQGYYNQDMQRGHDLEDFACCAYEIKTGQKTEKVGFCEMTPFVGASPDRFVLTPTEKGLLEIKCKSDSVYIAELLSDDIDNSHLYQMQMQMLVTDLNWCDYAVYNPNFENSLKITRVFRDLEKIDKLLSGLTKGAVMLKEILLKIQEKTK